MTTKFTCTVHYRTRWTPGGWYVWSSDDGGKTWQDFFGHMNDAAQRRVIERIKAQGGIELPDPGLFPTCLCGHAATTHGIPRTRQDIDVGIRGGIYPCRSCDCSGYCNSEDESFR